VMWVLESSLLDHGWAILVRIVGPSINKACWAMRPLENCLFESTV